jgi:hypothetical protein
MKRLTLLLPLLLLALTGCISRSLVGEPVYCQCAVPLLGRGGCSGYGIPFDSWACVSSTDSLVNACNNACMQVAGIGSGVFLSCVGYPGTEEPVAHYAPEFAGRCTPEAGGATGPLLATTGYESSPWDYVPARSSITLHNARDTESLTLASGTLSLFMPEGHTNPGPMRFDMLSLVGQPGAGGAFTFDGHTVRDFRLLNAGRFEAVAGPGYVTPPRPGQFNSYRIESGYPLNFTVVVDGVEVSDEVSDAVARTGWMYSDATGQYFVYEGVFPLGDDPKDPSTLSLHLEFRYGRSVSAPSLDIDRKDNGGTVSLTAVPGATSPGATYTFLWVDGLTLDSKAPVLSNGPTVTVDPTKLVDGHVSVLVYANEAKVWRQQSVCVLPKGC